MLEFTLWVVQTALAFDLCMFIELVQTLFLF